MLTQAPIVSRKIYILMKTLGIPSCMDQAFRELGRVVRTIFLLNYITDFELRKQIQAATCRSEEFNDFIDWVAFG